MIKKLFSKDYWVIKKSGLFDEEYYLRTYPDVREADVDPVWHYCAYGWREGRNPSARFDTAYYLATYQDVKKAGVNPLAHYVRYGRKEGRRPLQNSEQINQKESYFARRKNTVKKILTLIGNNPKLIAKFMTEVKANGLKYAVGKMQSKMHKEFVLMTSATASKNCFFKKANKEYSVKVSVIIPTYNRAKLLPGLLECWRNVHKVTKYKYEIIFSDDGSDDGSVPILEQEKELPIKVIRNNHGGAAKARNSAILEAEGEKLLIIGDDIFPNPEIINQHYEKLLELPICKAVLGEIIWHKDLEINILMKHITELGNEQFSFNAFMPYEYIDFRHFYTSNIGIDREFVISEKIIFDEAFYKVNFEDIELGYRLSKKGMEIYFYPDAIAEHYHPYKSVDGFCKRQETAGEMATVFQKLHSDVEWVLQVEKISIEWENYIKQLTKVRLENFQTIDKIITLCQKIEDESLAQKFNLEKYISGVYKVLFRFFYEKGVICSSQKIDDIMIQKVFALYFMPKIYHFFEKIIKMADLDINDFSYDSIEEYQCKLIIEVESFEIASKVKNKLQSLEHDILIRIQSQAKEFDNNYIYRPHKDFLPIESNLKQIILFMQNNSADVILLSYGLVDFPNIGLSENIENHLIFRNNGLSVDDMGTEKLRGKVIRIISEKNAKTVNIKDIIRGSIDEYGYWNKKAGSFIENDTTVYRAKVYKKSKKLIFVFPVFLAVGGVERNTAEIIKALKNEYDFVVVNFERLNEFLGSLHHQFVENCIGVYDLTELSSHEGIVKYLKILNHYYQPDLIWICNGSPWLEGNLGNIRDIFQNSAIVDQQVYDMNEGWVRLYKEKNSALLSFDRFIAINSKIKDVFLNDAMIQKDKVDLIYHVVNTERFDRELYAKKQPIYSEKYNVDTTKDNFIFVGRMSDQKRPFLFLDFVRKIVKENNKVHFYMVGTGPLADDVKKYILKQGLTNRITRITHIDNVAEIYSLMKGLIITSKFEGLPIAMLEAMCMGLPVFATNVGDIDVVIAKYKNGLMVDANIAPDELVKLFRIFYNNLDIYSTESLEASEKIRHEFSVDIVSGCYKNCFEKALFRKE